MEIIPYNPSRKRPRGSSPTYKEKRAKTEHKFIPLPFVKRKRKRRMPAKRKRSYSTRRTYKRRRTAPSASAIAKAMARLEKQTGPFGVKNSPTMTMYGPSRQQMLEDPSLFRTAEQTKARLRDNYRGPGGYWDDVGKNIGHWGSRIGGAALGMFNPWGLGGMVGATDVHSGWDKGAEFSKAMGWGAYNVGRGSNDLVLGSDGDGSTPVYHSAMGADEGGDVIVSNRELVKIVKSSATANGFTIEPFTINPADATFYHLKHTAAQYEQFEFLGLMFQYVPLTGEGGSNELGTIAMAANYDPAKDVKFNCLEDMMRYKGSYTCKPSVGALFGIECDPAKRATKTLYNRDEVDRDKAFTDPATFYFASEGVSTANATLGQLWVTYTVRFRNIKSIEDTTQEGSFVIQQALNPVVSSHLDLLEKFSYKYENNSGGATSEHVVLVPSSKLAQVQLKSFQVSVKWNMDSTIYNANPTVQTTNGAAVIPTNISGGVTVANQGVIQDLFNIPAGLDGTYFRIPLENTRYGLLQFYITIPQLRGNADVELFRIRGENNLGMSSAGDCTITLVEMGSTIDPSKVYPIHG